MCQLLSEEHQVCIVHGGTRAFIGGENCDSVLATPLTGEQTADNVVKVLGGQVNKSLVACLGRAGVQAIGICGVDANVVRLRRVQPGTPSNGHAMEVAAVDSFWLDIITRNGGVPVMANVALGPDRRYHCLCADQLAAACAIAWHADALIFLTGAEGVQNDDGSIMRWLESGQIATSMGSSAASHRMLSKLVACHHALKHGVHRARIFPVCRMQSLPDFYIKRIDCGTEIILASSASRA